MDYLKFAAYDMTVVLDFLCDYFKCTIEELNNYLKEPKAWEKLDEIGFGNRKNQLNSKYSMVNPLSFFGFSQEPANLLIYEDEDTVEQWYKNEKNVKLKYPNLVCLWEKFDESIDLYYPLEIVEIYGEICNK